MTTRVSRTDVQSCQCFRGVGALAGADECSCRMISHDDPSGPKFRAQGPSAEDRAQAARDHAATQDERPNVVQAARDAMVARNQNAYKSAGNITAPHTDERAHVDANETPLERARREMNERHLNAYKKG